MHKPQNIIHVFILCLFIILPASQVNATRNIDFNLLEYSLSLSKINTYFNFDSGNNVKTSMNQLGINWYESFSPYFHAGLEFGYIEMSQIDNPLSSARFTAGQYAGLLFQFLAVENSYLTLNLNLNYRYNRTQGKNAVQESQFIWSESTLTGELHFRPSSNIGLFIGADYRLLDGNQRNSGNINQIRLFKGSQSQGFRIGSKISVNSNGEIKLQWTTGFKDSVEVHFTRTF